MRRRQVLCHAHDEDRNVSAEIFVICRQFRAPKYIDPKFLDPKHVFKDVAASAPLDLDQDKGTSLNNVHANVFQPEKKRRRRDGYDEGDYTLFKKISAGDFVRGPDPISTLGMANKISFETGEEQGYAAILNHDIAFTYTDEQVAGSVDNLYRRESQR
jgi:AdoMet-dependent rRNA methyltransferase SPB1